MQKNGIVICMRLYWFHIMNKRLRGFFGGESVWYFYTFTQFCSFTSLQAQKKNQISLSSNETVEFSNASYIMYNKAEMKYLSSMCRTTWRDLVITFFVSFAILCAGWFIPLHFSLTKHPIASHATNEWQQISHRDAKPMGIWVTILRGLFLEWIAFVNVARFYERKRFFTRRI